MGDVSVVMAHACFVLAVVVVVWCLTVDKWDGL